MSQEFVSTRPLLDKLGVKPGAKVALVNLRDPGFTKLLRTRTSDITTGRPTGPFAWPLGVSPLGRAARGC